MAGLKRSVVVQAPVEKVFAYLNDPNKLLEYWPGMQEVKDVQPLENGSTRFRFTFRFAGIRLDGMSEDTEIIPNKRMVSRTTGSVDGTVTWDLEPVEDGTRVNFVQTYEVPVTLIGRFAENVVTKLSEHDTDVLMSKMKLLDEAQ